MQFLEDMNLGRFSVGRLRGTRLVRVSAIDLMIMVVALVVGLVVVPPAGATQTKAEQVETVLAELGERFEVEILGTSYLLKARAGDDDIEIVQVSARSILVDLERVSRSELEARLDDHADLVLELVERGFVTSEKVDAAEGNEGLPPTEAEPARRIEATTDRDEDLEDARDDRRERTRRARSRHSRGLVRSDTRVSFGSGLKIADDESAREVVVFGGPLEIEGEVRGDAVVVGGSARVNGEVNGSLTAVGGSVAIEDEGRVYGDVISVGGTVDIDPEARVTGEVTELAFGPMFGIGDWDFDDWDHRRRWSFPHFYWPFGDLIDAIANTVLLTILVVLTMLVARGWVERSAARALAEPWKAGLVGLLAQLLFVPLLVVACIVLVLSIIGIPLVLLLIPVSILGILFVSLVGFSGIATSLGRRMEDRFDWNRNSPYIAAIIGLVLIQIWWILGEGLSFLGGPIGFTAALLLFFGFVVKYLAWTVGLGGTLLAHLSSNPVPAPPAVPPASWDRADGGGDENAEDDSDSFTGLGGGFDPLAEAQLDREVEEAESATEREDAETSGQSDEDSKPSS